MAVRGTRRHSAPSVCVCACSRASGERARVSSPMKYECRSASGMPQALGVWSSSPLPSLPIVRGPCAQRPQPEALTVTQRHSLSLSGEWREEAVTIFGVASLIGGIQSPFVAIRSRQWLKECHQMQTGAHIKECHQMQTGAQRCTQLHSGASSCTQLRISLCSCVQSVSLTLAAGMWPSATSSSTRVATTSVRSELEMAIGASSRAMPSGLLPLTLGPLLVGGQST